VSGPRLPGCLHGCWWLLQGVTSLPKTAVTAANQLLRQPTRAACPLPSPAPPAPCLPAAEERCCPFCRSPYSRRWRWLCRQHRWGLCGGCWRAEVQAQALKRPVRLAHSRSRRRRLVARRAPAAWSLPAPTVLTPTLPNLHPRLIGWRQRCSLHITCNRPAFCSSAERQICPAAHQLSPFFLPLAAPLPALPWCWAGFQPPPPVALPPVALLCPASTVDWAYAHPLLCTTQQPYCSMLYATDKSNCFLIATGRRLVKHSPIQICALEEQTPLVVFLAWGIHRAVGCLHVCGGH
jgi:hypothetical protein